MAMKRLFARLSRLLRNEWRDIDSAPFDREIEVAVVLGNISVPGGLCLRDANGWLDSETLAPIEMTATHWRYRWPALLPLSCC